MYDAHTALKFKAEYGKPVMGQVHVNIHSYNDK